MSDVRGSLWTWFIRLYAAYFGVCFTWLLKIEQTIVLSKKDRRLTNKHSKRCVKIIINAVVSRINSLKSIRVWFPLVYLILQILIVIIFYLCICNFKKNIIRSKFYKLQNIQDTFNMRIRISIIYHFEMLYSLQPILL